MSAAELYREVENFLLIEGWQRINERDGWWWNVRFDAEGDYTIGEAFQEELARQGIDVRLKSQLSHAS